MYAIKIPSYTKNFKLHGHLFQVYNVISIQEYPNSGNMLMKIDTDSYIDFEKKGKLVKKSEIFNLKIKNNPSLDKIFIETWSGSSPIAYFDNLEDAIIYKAKANEKVKQILFDKLEEIKSSIEKQSKKINITNKDIIEKYPEYFL